MKLRIIVIGVIYFKNLISPNIFKKENKRTKKKALEYSLKRSWQTHLEKPKNVDVMLVWSPKSCSKISTKLVLNAPLTSLETKNINFTPYALESNQLIPFLHKITPIVSPTWNTNATYHKNNNTQNTKVQDLGAQIPM